MVFDKKSLICGPLNECFVGFYDNSCISDKDQNFTSIQMINGCLVLYHYTNLTFGIELPKCLFEYHSFCMICMFTYSWFIVTRENQWQKN